MRSKTGDIETLMAARLWTQPKPNGESWTQEEIGKQLGVSQAVVSRLVGEARAKGWLIATKEEFNAAAVPAEMLELAIARLAPRPGELEALLHKATGKAAPEVTVYPSGAGDWDSRLQQFAQTAAPQILRLLQTSNICGVSWGDSIASIVTSMIKLLPAPTRARRPIRIIPLIGDPHWRGYSSRIGSSKLAEDLEQALVGPVEQPPSMTLTGVPPLIPPEVEDHELQTAYKVIEGRPGYKELLGSRKPGTRHAGREPLASRLDCILTSSSRDGRPLGYGRETLFTKSRDGKGRKLDLLGDLCGVLVHSDQGFSHPHPLDQRLTGIRRAQLIECARRARAKGARGPGVICVAIGGNKAAVLARCLSAINHLYIDQELADQLEGELRKGASSI